ncbi:MULTISPECIES: DUF3299 domain-containing protein [Pseudoalteromonas]|jgi:hypothetical protein|uniref:Uncharacterized protein n=1 Tax=Pseudoalteromonas agarivorans DSM 14585 TaxID=1312369 RepID=A0ACA8DSU1_9GAMM|nr:MULTISPECIES: DUF3299 domain-containing protein [Pseudoalteromonas]MDY6887110.1 DUF3299 domain-containing protein [Pseudomonadota bacterium]HAG38556.1 DUF3299 domain-containing protein [Pseudoalteromonas sp.]ATC81110.1 hypothetical protein PAGA_a0566 [Pseudoalteromonas agarivorans DSM 14585]AZN33791.1 DUF3299 domain-containing protein [Pseudoalteromonas sp. Xi13]ENN97435.1 hypothetical protein J139_17234 [Pseudoalteromonas agarivorans S816]|tara:strand:+ start:626 stop:1126 length:501 start_codon:yes stop_codon:yes gene_type:complete
MILFKSALYYCTLVSCLLISFVSSANPPKEIFWEDLIPQGHVQIDTQAQANHEGSEQNWVQPELDAPVVEALNGQSVSLPGFVVPLEGDSEVITEFLLVPYFGACIHVPPPPPNQIVHVTVKGGVPIESLYDAIVVTGVISTETWSGEIAQVGYKMKAVGVAPFEL